MLEKIGFVVNRDSSEDMIPMTYGASESCFYKSSITSAVCVESLVETSYSIHILYIILEYSVSCCCVGGAMLVLFVFVYYIK